MESMDPNPQRQKSKRLKMLQRVSALVVTAGVGLLTLMIVVVLTPLPSVVISPSPSRRFVAVDGSLLADRTGRAGTRNQPVDVVNLSPHLVHATLAGEDHRFYEHGGVDTLGIVRAIQLDIQSVRFAYGGSTITQQLARLVFPGPRTLPQKLRETFWALVMERHLSKNELLALYLSRAPYGRNLTGVSAASEAWFGKPPSALSLAEASFLAVLPRAPSRFDPLTEQGPILKRRSHVLGLMVKRGFITPQQQQAAEDEPLHVQAPQSPLKAPHALMQLQHLEGTVQTTLDVGVQERVETLLRTTVQELRSRGVMQAAALVMELPDGDVRAYVGSADFNDVEHQGQVDGVQARRSPGSTLKPLIYAAALEQGFTAATLLRDEARPFPADNGVYLPRNFDLREHGPVRLREALANSFNLASVDLADRLGAPRVLDAVRSWGIPLTGKTSEDLGLGVVLGGVDVSLMELAGAYLALARGGRFVEPRLVAGTERQERHVVSAATAWLITDILSDDLARSGTFQRHSALSLPFSAAVKTGTSKDFRDNWAVGYSTRYLVATWAGDFAGKPMAGVSGVTGAGALWHRIMRSIHGEDPPPFARLRSMEEVTICADSGLKAAPQCPRTLREHFAPQHQPRDFCDQHGGMLEDAAGGLVLVTPSVGATYRVDPDRPGEGWGLPVTARGPHGVVLTVHVDGVLVASGRGGVRGSWRATQGTHHVVLASPTSRVDGTFEVQ